MLERIRNAVDKRAAAVVLAGSLVTTGALSTGAQAAEARPTKTDIINLQKDFNGDLTGLPKLAVDGKAGELTKRALCMERLLTGGKASRSLEKLTRGEVVSLFNTDRLRSPAVAELGGRSLANGMLVSETCQAAAIIKDRKISRLIPVATGVPGHETPNFVTTMTWGRRGMHDSSKYPSESGNGNMENPEYFRADSSYAVHGGVTSTKPLSHGCVRVPSAESARLWKENGGPANSRIDAPVALGRPMTIVITGAYEYGA